MTLMFAPSVTTMRTFGYYFWPLVYIRISCDLQKISKAKRKINYGDALQCEELTSVNLNNFLNTRGQSKVGISEINPFFLLNRCYQYLNYFSIK